MPAIQLIAATLLGVAAPGMKPKALVAAVRDKHPEASKREIVRAAFNALTDTGAVNHDAVLQLQGFALGERGTGEPDPERPRKKPKAKPRKPKLE